ncbi:MAG: hypothetical protein HC789_04665 [Microcoleus sp. CSU_2_2]|nr:hypothetical protein [Microcoleus sp. SU_5_3]NJS09718.1 hypothetical protein [Microcoleus sp. CSU_2_2]
MDKKLLMGTMKLARFMLLPTLMVITSLSLAKQELSSVRLTEDSVFSNFPQEGGLYAAKEQPDNWCTPPGTCERATS